MNNSKSLLYGVFWLSTAFNILLILHFLFACLQQYSLKFLMELQKDATETFDNQNQIQMQLNITNNACLNYKLWTNELT